MVAAAEFLKEPPTEYSLYLKLQNKSSLRHFHIFQVQLVVSLHYLLLMQSDLYNNFGQHLQKVRGIIGGMVQNHLVFIDYFMNHE